MTTGIAILIVVVSMALLTYAGVRDGAFHSVYALLRNLLAFLCAMTFCQPAALLLRSLVSRGARAYDYFVAISFAAVFGIVFAVARWLKVKYPPDVPCVRIVSQASGAVFGFINAVVVTGTVLILWSLLPFIRYIPADHGRIHITAGLFDTGATMLRFYKFAEQRMGGNTPFLLNDEPVDDLNNNGRGDPGEQYDDENLNGIWDRGWLWKYRNNAEILPSNSEFMPRPAPPP